MKINNVEAAIDLISAARTAADLIGNSGPELILATGKLKDDDGCMCAIGHMLHIAGIPIKASNENDWCGPIEKALDVVIFDGAAQVIDIECLTRPIYRANDGHYRHQIEIKPDVAKELRVFAEKLKALL